MKHIIRINRLPQRSGRSAVPDGAISGNGDLSIITGCYDGGLRLYICKVDIWEAVQAHSSGGLHPLGYIDIDISKEILETFTFEQDLDKGEIRCTFIVDKKKEKINFRVCKAKNLIMLEKNCSIDINPVLKAFENTNSGRKGEYSKNNVDLIFRSFDADNCVFETHAYCGMKKLCANVWTAYVLTNHDIGISGAQGIDDLIIKELCALDLGAYKALLKDHYDEWLDFWNKSSVTLSDESLEINWYASNYYLALCAGNNLFPPGLFGNFVCVDTPPWKSDYHLNYNYQAPFYAACSSNHPELTDCYSAPLEDFLENGRNFALKFGARGIIYPVGIGPKGIYTEYQENLPHWFERLFLGQKNNQIHPADIMVFRWKSTRDLDYAKNHAYPYLKECIEFFVSLAVFEKGRYWIIDDAVHEVPMYRDSYDPSKREYRFIHDKNNILTLGLLRLCIPAAIEMARNLGIDEDKCVQWEDFLNKLSPYPTTIRHGKKVYRYCEKGQRWNDGNDVGLQHIYPGCAVGLLSDKKEIKIARNTFRQKWRSCRLDDNAVSSIYPMAARLGYNPKKIIKALKKNNCEKQLPNLLFDYCGGLEYCSINASAINEMVLQSFQGVILLFPCWDENINCQYHHLRADGAFLVSSSMINAEIGRTTIFSEKGGKLKIKNPFKSAVIKHGNRKYITRDLIIEIACKPGETIILSNK